MRIWAPKLQIPAHGLADVAARLAQAQRRDDAMRLYQEALAVPKIPEADAAAWRKALEVLKAAAPTPSATSPQPGGRKP